MPDLAVVDVHSGCVSLVPLCMLNIHAASVELCITGAAHRS